MNTLPASSYVKSYDPTISLNKDVKIALQSGAQTVTYQTTNADSFSASSISWNSCNPPNKNTIVDRKFFVRNSMRLIITGTGVVAGSYLLNTDGRAAGTPPGAYTGGLVGNVDALRAFPLAQSMQTMELTLNSQTFSTPYNQYIEPLLRYSNYRDIGEQDWSLTPSMQDTMQAYDDFQVYGSTKSPLGNYGDDGYKTPRGGFAGLNVVAQFVAGQPIGTASTGPADVCVAWVDVQYTEPLMISPLVFAKGEHRGIVGINTCSIVLKYDSKYKDYIWSHDEVSSGVTLNNIEIQYDTVSTPAFVGRPAALFRYLTPRIKQDVPEINLFPYNNILSNPNTTTGVLQPGASGQFTYNTLQLNSVFKRIYIFARERQQDRSFNNPDAYAFIKNVNLSFGNLQAQLSNASPQALYNMSVTNGCQMSWTQWSKQIGSVICIDSSKDLSVDTDALTGSGGSFQLFFTLDMQNISRRPISYEINCVVVEDGYLRIYESSVMVSTNLGDTASLMDNPAVKEIDWKKNIDSFYGNGFKEDLKKAAIGAAKNIAKSYGPDAVQMLLSSLIPGVGSEIGYGARKILESAIGGKMTDAEYKKVIKELMKMRKRGGGMVGGSFAGAGVVGGAQASKGKMKAKMLRY